VKLFGCRKYLRLSYDARDRELKPREERFLSRHSAVCEPCSHVAEEGAFALNLLRACVIEPEVKHNFDERVIRRLRVQTVGTSLRYWSPAIIGAGVAGLVILAALQMIAQSSKLPSFHVPGGEARLTNTMPAFPPSLETANYRHITQ